MNQKIKKTFSIISKTVLVSLLASFSVNSIQIVVGATTELSSAEKKEVEKKVDSIDNALQDKQEDLQTLEQKAQNYQRMIDLKRQQQTTLQNQLGLMDIQIDNFSTNVDLTKAEIEKNLVDINQLQTQVDAKQQEVNKTKNELSEMINSYNQLDSEISLQMLSSNGDISTYLNGVEYLDQASQKVDQVLSEIKAKKQELQADLDIFTKKNEELKAKKYQLEERIFYLNNEKSSKDILLSETKGEEAKYQQLLERVEQQKQELIGDIDSLSDDKKGELAKIKSEAPTPGTTASSAWYYSQKDPRWGSNRIGLSSTLMKDYGCAVTSLAMAFTYLNQSITPGKLAQQPIFYRDLIVWPQYWKGLQLVSGNAHGNISWSKIDEELKLNNPVIVFVRARGGRGHYVVIHSKDKKGKYVVHDPLFGPNLYLETTEKLVGAIYNSSVTEDQMLIYHK